MLSDGSGNPPVDWTPADSVGIMELVNDDLALFTADSGAGPTAYEVILE